MNSHEGLFTNYVNLFIYLFGREHGRELILQMLIEIFQYLDAVFLDHDLITGLVKPVKFN